MKQYGFKTKKSIADKVKKYYPNDYKQLISKARKNRKEYSIDLSKIDCEFNAYFIGLMLSDGYIQDNNKFGLQLTDEDCIKFISEATNNPYHEYRTKNDNFLPCYRIVFSDLKQKENLKRYGVVSCKSKIIQPPQLTKAEKHYVPYILRGIIDGDGCIYTTSKGSVAFYICTMSQDFAQWIKEQLEQILFMKDIFMHQRHHGIWIIETALQSNIFKLIALVYDKPYGMQRKYQKLRKTFRDYNSGNPDFMLD